METIASLRAKILTKEKEYFKHNEVTILNELKLLGRKYLNLKLSSIQSFINRHKYDYTSDIIKEMVSINSKERFDSVNTECNKYIDSYCINYKSLFMDEWMGISRYISFLDDEKTKNDHIKLSWLYSLKTIYKTDPFTSTEYSSFDCDNDDDDNN